MGKKVGSAVSPCPQCADEPTGKPVDQAKHKNCSIKILSIKEKDNDEGPDYLGGGSEIFVKGLTKDLVIKYEVKVCQMSVTLWLEFDPGNKVHADFYKTYEGNGVTAPRVLVVVSGETKDPGVHEALWDGRDRTPDHRILLDGTYKVRIQGLHDATPEDTNKIRIMPPLAWNFGIHYTKSSGATETTKKEIEHARESQTGLSDGTAFTAESSCSSVASIAWDSIASAAIGVISGHSNPSMLAFYPEESAKGKPAAFNSVRQSYILTMPRPNPPPKKPKGDIDNSTFMPEEPANAMRDVFLVVLAGCRASNEVLLLQHRLKELSKAFDPGKIDKKHGPKTTAALKAWQNWESVAPDDGTKNEATLQKLGIDASLDEKEQTGQVQKKLKGFSKRYDPGKEDGLWGDDTEKAITHYQQDHSPPLDVTGLPDKATLKHLHPSGTLGGEARDIAEAFTVLGCNIAFGFVQKVSFTGAEKWHINFWDLVKKGSGVDDAATEARELCGAKHIKELDYVIYTRSGVDKNSLVHPARHGKDM